MEASFLDSKFSPKSRFYIFYGIIFGVCAYLSKMKLTFILLIDSIYCRKFSGQCERDAHFEAKENVKKCRNDVFKKFGITDIEKRRQKTQT